MTPTCPVCQSPLEADSCPSCVPAPARTAGSLIVPLLLVSLLAMLLITVAGTIVVPAFVASRQQATRVRCADNLRAVGLAALAYADDQGSFPHRRGIYLDQGVESGDGPWTMRLLQQSGALDPQPELWICPARPRLRHGDKDERAAQRAWFAGRDPAPPPPLDRMDCLSYGWTRRSLSPNAAGQTRLAADKAVFQDRDTDQTVVGNHADGWTVLNVDGSHTWLPTSAEPFPGNYLAKTADAHRDGFLGIADQDDSTLFR